MLKGGKATFAHAYSLLLWELSEFRDEHIMVNSNWGRANNVNDILSLAALTEELMTKLVELQAELVTVFVGLHAHMTDISLPQAELKLFLDQHHEVLKNASFFMVTDNRGTLDLFQGQPLRRCSQTSSH